MSNSSPKEKKSVEDKKNVKGQVQVNPFVNPKKGKGLDIEDDIEEEDEEDIDEDEDEDDEDDEDEDDEDEDDEDEDDDEQDADVPEPQSMIFGEVLDSVLSRHFEYSQEENTLSMAEIMLLIKQSIDAQTAVLSEILRLKISKYGANRSSSKEKETPEERVIRKQREAASRR